MRFASSLEVGTPSSPTNAGRRATAEREKRRTFEWGEKRVRVSREKIDYPTKLQIIRPAIRVRLLTDQAAELLLGDDVLSRVRARQRYQLGNVARRSKEDFRVVTLVNNDYATMRKLHFLRIFAIAHE